MEKTLYFFRNPFYRYFEFIVSKFMKFSNEVFRLNLVFITEWSLNQNERFFPSNKFVGIIKNSSKLFIDLMKSFTISSMDRNK